VLRQHLQVGYLVPAGDAAGMIAMAMGETEPAHVRRSYAVGVADLDDAGQVAPRAGVEHHPAIARINGEDRAVIGIGQVEPLAM
jgi:hypothetical protein